jgi:hypothetical protein
VFFVSYLDQGGLAHSAVNLEEFKEVAGRWSSQDRRFFLLVAMSMLCRKAGRRDMSTRRRAFLNRA